ncbi:glutathione S-transferase [Burkholderia stagnalis]|uniref:glutathione binding-like protein n=1 Tax=Burkholderia stagnalis TaxID=1503054 RepID=UPI00075C94F5|nr:glutathione binding-like protein [Burkholderia stagnalis]KVN34662.1 glutathione S-transferase [Burkholderia stagnalis]KWH30661.1 glutathione S-transferase [Burkholderia stagnalis]KWH42588.1 glutathione S-transferase [Burkholderia stagnalis]RQQ06073.1 glutathione S-transferase [Burkholderia stagnalis]RQQ15071.1 glutathione S-transferase [Burkholderia stagnalis]
MKLYHAPGSCSQAICIVLRELNLDAEVVKVDARRHLVEDGGNYYDVTELGYVPLLALADGTTLREGPAIAQYLADQRPEAGLAPAFGTLARYRLIEWLNFLSAEIHKGFIPLLYAVQAGKYVDPARQKLASRFAWIDRQLDGRTYLTGDAFTVADAYLFALTGWGKAAWMQSVYNADIDLGPYAHLAAWYARVRSRPSVQYVLAADGPLR